MKLKSNKFLWCCLTMVIILIPLSSSASIVGSNSNEMYFSIPANSFCDQSHKLDISLVLTNVNTGSVEATLALYKQDGSALTTVGTSNNGINSTITPGTAITIASNNTAFYHLSYGGQVSNCTDRVFLGKIVLNSGTVGSVLASGWINGTNGNTPIIINSGQRWDVSVSATPTITPTPTLAPTATPVPTVTPTPTPSFFTDDITIMMTSATAPAPNVVTDSSANYFHAGWEEWKAFNHNNDQGGSWVTEDYSSLPQWIMYDFGSGNQKNVKKYRLTSGNSFTNDIVSGSLPKSWTFEGSNTGSALEAEWTILDSRTNETNWGSKEARSFTINNNNSYRYYRVNITLNNGNTSYTSIGEVEMMLQDVYAPQAITNLSLGTVTSTTIPLAWTSTGDDGNEGLASSNDIRYSTSAITELNWASATQVSGEPITAISGISQSMTISGLTPNTSYYFAIKTIDQAGNVSNISNVPNATTPQFDYTNVVPTMTSSTAPSGIVSASNFAYNPYLSFDHSGADYGWIPATSGFNWIGYEFTTSKTIKRYTITVSNQPTRSPKSWTFEGWDGSAWVVLNTQTNITSWSAYEKKIFDISNNTAYIKYRLNISLENSAQVIINELELMTQNP